MYTHTSWVALQTALANRLGDPNNIFWTATEILLYLRESMRTFGVCSGFWRERGTVAITSGNVFYDLRNLISPALLSYSVTDRDIIQQIQYALLESAADQTAWSGTEMFTYSDIVTAIQRRRDQFLSDTGITVTRSVVAVASPPIGRQTLSESIIDVRRVAWVGASPYNYYNPLWREDERLLTAADPQWAVTEGAPECWSIMAPPPLTLQIAPLPQANGELELLTVDSGGALDPATAATILPIPDDLTPAIKWGALADLLGIDGIARDVTRAQFCEQRYAQYVTLARNYPTITHCEINGVPLIASTLFELESSTPNWQNQSGTPQDLVIAAPNLIALNPPPNDVYSVTLDVIRNTPVDTGVDVQVGREQLDMILDYAEHLALFKVAGPEWQATTRQANNFLLQSVTYNQRLSAAARAAFSASEQSQRQKQGIPRRNEQGVGLGALKGVPQGGGDGR